MKTISLLRPSAIVLGSIIACSLFSCMKKQCYSCLTSYPVGVADSFLINERQQTYCDITAERAQYLEQTGTKDTVLSVRGDLRNLKITTTCEPGR
jgi:hypothetical protein